MTKRYAYTAQVNAAHFSRQVPNEAYFALPKGRVRLFSLSEGEVVSFE